ncbi:ankyrin repeat and SAM domain-containing protein 6-like [Tigriopus californicus]|uniref:ankyrin repeat and SAM domain-containing protein 6-like n=1 Tax=Tigriopus californicus TaxID=6832 RepID=UPI0027DA0F8A|nr:ankyrin repeat and SAM domain-containing protein 6-like [Tigriopus californicus]
MTIADDHFHVHELFRACEIGDPSLVQQIILNHQLSVDVRDNDDITGLQVAAANDQIDIVKLLIKKKANLNTSNSSGWAPLHHGAFHGHTKMCHLLIRHGADVSARNKFGATPLNIATASGHQSTVKCLLEAGATLDEENVPQFTNCPLPFSTAALFARTAVLRNFIAKLPALVNITNPDSLWTPLMLAASSGSKPTVQLLIENGADPNKLNGVDETALDISVTLGRNEVKAFLDGITTVRNKTESREGRVQEEYFDAIRGNNVSFISELIHSKLIDVNCTDNVGATGLMIASISGHLDVVKTLVALKASLDLQDRVNGWTALMQATFYGHKAIAKYLLDNGANPCVAAFNNCTALDLASLVEETDTQLLRLLAGKTIDKAPPLLMLDFKKNALERSVSVADFGRIRSAQRKGFKGWFGRLSGQLRKLKPDMRSKVSINIIPSEPGHVNGIDDMRIEEFATLENDVGVDINGSIFTLGFSAATTDLSSYGVSPLEPPLFHTMQSSTNKHSPVSDILIPNGFSSKSSKSKQKSAPTTEKLLNSSKSDSEVQEKNFRHSTSSKRETGQDRKKSKRSHKRSRSLNFVPKPTLNDRKDLPRKHHHHHHHHSHQRHDSKTKRPPTSLEELLEQSHLSHLLSLFQKEEIDLAALKIMDEADLKDLGITRSRDRKNILKQAKDCP